jgi:hypothetical protein
MPSFAGAWDLFPTAASKPPAGAVLDPRHPLAHSVMGCWLFNEAGSVAKDLSRFGAHIKCAQTLSTAVPFHQGFAGLTGWYTPTQGTTTPIGSVSAPHLALPLPTITVEWYGVLASNAGGNRALLAYGEDGNTNSGWIIWASSANQMMWTVGTGTRTDLVWGAGSYYTGRPVHIVGTWQGTAPSGGTNLAQLYVNGALFTTATRGLAGSGTTLRFHSRTNMGPPQALTSHVVIYNRVLTPAEIQDRYRRPYALVMLPGQWGRTLVAADSFTGTAAVTAQVATASAAGTVTAPTYSGTAAPSAQTATASLAGTYTSSTVTGTAAVSGQTATASLAGAVRSAAEE